MKKIASLLLATLVAFPLFAGDDLVARQGKDVARLTDKPCTSELVLSRIDKSVQDKFQAASAIFGGQHFNACWTMMGNAAYLIYEDGDQGIIPATELKPDKIGTI